MSWMRDFLLRNKPFATSKAQEYVKTLVCALFQEFTFYTFHNKANQHNDVSHKDCTCIHNMSHYKLHLSSYESLNLFSHIHTYKFIRLRQYKKPYLFDQVFLFCYTVFTLSNYICYSLIWFMKVLTWRLLWKSYSLVYGERGIYRSRFSSTQH
jgi:hypothetical protein